MLPTPPIFGCGVVGEMEGDVARMLDIQHLPTPNSLKGRRIIIVGDFNICSFFKKLANVFELRPDLLDGCENISDFAIKHIVTMTLDVGFAIKNIVIMILMVGYHYI